MTEDETPIVDVLADPRSVGPYQILGELGRGGMARVYKALQPSVNRIVALKVFPQHLEEDAVAVRRFTQEAQTAANLKHNNIVRVWDACVLEPPFYIAMEFLDGGTLSDRLANGAIALEQAVSIMCATCSALQHAHDRGIIHRDIKPENIMFDEHNKPVLTDFGIARVTEQTRLTVAGTAFGTPDYMSPEQAEGKTLDYRSDLYSASVVFYEMLVGHPPFSNDNPLVTMRQISDEPIPSPHELGVQVPASVETVLMKALAKNPDERYQSAEQLGSDLWTAYTSGKPVAAPHRPKTSKQVTRTTAGRRSSKRTTDSRQPVEQKHTSRKRLTVALLCVVTALVGVTVYAILTSRSQDGTKINSLPQQAKAKSSKSTKSPIKLAMPTKPEVKTLQAPTPTPTAPTLVPGAQAKPLASTQVTMKQVPHHTGTQDKHPTAGGQTRKNRRTGSGARHGGNNGSTSPPPPPPPPEPVKPPT